MSPTSPSFSSTNSCLHNTSNNIKFCNLSKFNDHKMANDGQNTLNKELVKDDTQ